MSKSIRRYTPPLWQGHPDEVSGFFTWDLVTEKETLLVECEDPEDEQAEKKAQELWKEKYGSEIIEVDPSDNVETVITSNIRADFQSAVVAKTAFAVLRMTLFHLQKRSLVYVDALVDHPVSDLHAALVEEFSDHPELRRWGISAVDVLWVDEIACDDLEAHRNHVADCLIHLRDDFVADGLVAMERETFFSFLPCFETIEKYLYYGEFLELQKSRKRRPMR